MLKIPTTKCVLVSRQNAFLYSECKHDSRSRTGNAGTEKPLPVFAVQTEVHMHDVAFDIGRRAVTATACLTAWFDRDASLQEHLQRALAGTHFENLARPGKVDFE